MDRPGLTYVYDELRRVLRSYSRFISEILDDATVEPLASQLEQRGRADEFSALMGKFVERELAEFLVDTVRLEEPAIERAEHLETMDRLLTYLREDANARARRAPSPLSFELIELHNVLKQN
jgi:hypothetical protein